MKILTAILVTIFLSLPLVVHAQGVPCGPEDPAKNLLKLHDEHPRVVGMTNRGAMMTLYISDKGNWSLIVFLPRQVLFCMVDSGEQIEFIPAPKLKKK